MVAEAVTREVEARVSPAEARPYRVLYKVTHPHTGVATYYEESVEGYDMTQALVSAFTILDAQHALLAQGYTLTPIVALPETRGARRTLDRVLTALRLADAPTGETT